MSLRYGILGLLHYGPSTGYDIKTFFNDSLALFWEAQTSQIYRELGALERDGLARSEMVIQQGKPNKKVFFITEEGERAFFDWMKVPFGDDSYTFKSPLLMKLFFAAGQAPEITLAMLDRFLSEMKEALAQMSGVTRHIDGVVQRLPFQKQEARYWTLTADFGYRYFVMAIEWAEHAREEVAKELPR